MKSGLLLAALLHTEPLRAEPLAGLGQWSGHGSVFSPDGHALGDFTVELTRTAVGPRSVETRGNVRLATGRVIAISERMTFTDAGFVTESARGKGSGFCLDGALCHSYRDEGNLKGSAVTVIIDAPDQLRVLVTELEQGKPVQFIRQKLTKKK